MKAIVIFDYTKRSDDEINMFVVHVIDCMTDNPNYTDCGPYVTAVTTEKAKFEASLALAMNGGHIEIAAKNQDRKALEEVLKNLGLYVQLNCKNDLSILLSSGFNAKKDSEPIGILPKPENVKVVPGPFSGSVKVSVEAIYGAHVYVYQMTDAPVTAQSNWKMILGKKIIIIRDLIPGKQYAFKVAGKGAADGEVYSDVITFFVS